MSTPTDEQINAAIELLRGAGFRVEKPELSEWVSPFDLWLRFGSISHAAFLTRLKNFKGEFPVRRGASGRLIELRATVELLDWLRRPAQPGKRLQMEAA